MELAFALPVWSINNFCFKWGGLHACFVYITVLEIGNVMPVMEDGRGVTQESINELTNSLKNIQESMSSESVGGGIVRFDRLYKMFYKTQNIKWLRLEFIFPVLFRHRDYCLLTKMVSPHQLNSL